MDTSWAHASEIAAAVSDGRTSATAVVGGALARIAKHDRVLNAFTAVTEERALAKAAAIDAERARGRRLGVLAGVPFAVKNLFDVAGLPTLAGSKINRDRAPVARDATVIARLEAHGAVLVGALNMGEYAYDFTGENVHDGASRNPHDVSRMTGGSSGGSGGAVAGGLVPIALGSDTNGSIRVPASLCGIFGLKPTYGRLSRAHTFPFVASLDHVGPLARSTRDLALAYDAMQGHDDDDPVCAQRPVEAAAPLLARGSEGLRIAIAGGYFRAGASAQAQTALARVDAVLAPATPCTAPAIGQRTFVLDGVELPVRANLGIYTQPISFIGLPVVAVPVPLQPLPIGVQIIAAPWCEDVALRIAHALEQAGIVAAARPSLEGGK